MVGSSVGFGMVYIYLPRLASSFDRVNLGMAPASSTGRGFLDQGTVSAAAQYFLPRKDEAYFGPTCLCRSVSKIQNFPFQS